MVSIKDVARRAGVSAQTISNCLNNPSIVKQATRETVAEAIRQLGYTPNASARRLRTQQINTIAIGIAPSGYSIIHDRILHAIVTEADAHHARVLLYKTDSPEEELRQFEALTNSGDVDSFVITGTEQNDPRIPWLIEHRQAFVSFGRPWGLTDAHDPRVPWVDVDGRRGITAMTQHLILHGRKRIGFIGWPTHSGTEEDRKAGWRDALLAAKMAAPGDLDDLCAYGDDSIGAGQSACATLMERHHDVDAIICVSDTLATGAIMALPRDRDIVVTGFDNTMSAQSLGFPTVDQPLTQAAHEIVRIIHEQHVGQTFAPAGSIPTNGASGARLHVLLEPTVIFPDGNAYRSADR